MVRNKEIIQREIRINSQSGTHTFSICLECGKKGHRGGTRACNNCLVKELNNI